MTYQSNVSVPLTQMSQLHNKRKESTTNETSTTGGNENENRSLRSPSVSSTPQPPPPVVSNLIKIYSEATTKSKPRETDQIRPVGKHDELIKIFEQASTNQNQQKRPSSSTYIKQQAKAQEEAYEDVTWDHVAHE